MVRVVLTPTRFHRDRANQDTGQDRQPDMNTKSPA